MGAAAGLGSRVATFTAYRPDDGAFREREIVALAEHDEAMFAAYVDGRERSPDQLLDEAAAQTRAAVLHPVFAGSAATGAGVPELMAGIARLLPTTATVPDAAGAASGRVFKVERGVAGREDRLRPDVLRLGADPAAGRPSRRPDRQGGGDPGLRGRSVGASRRGHRRSDRTAARAHLCARGGRLRRLVPSRGAPLPAAHTRGVGRGGGPGAATGAAGRARPARRPGPVDRRPHRRGRPPDGVAVRSGAAGGASRPRSPRSTASRWSSPTPA